MNDEILKLLLSLSFGQNGGIVLDSGETADTSAEDTTNNYFVFLPDTDGTFGNCKSNMKGLNGSKFYAGIPKYFKATYIEISAGSGTLYKTNNG